MRLGRAIGALGLVLAVIAAYGLYAPQAVDGWSPGLGALAHRYHEQIWGKAPQAAATASRDQTRPLEGVAPIAVSVTPAKRADFPIVLESLGQVQPYNTVLVRARVDGEIIKIGFKEGQIVQQGDLLAQIDPRPFQAALDQAVAKKAQDESTLANAKLDLTRYTTLAKQSFATEQQLDTQNALVNQLTATIAADAAAIDAAEGPVRLHDDSRAAYGPRRLPAHRRRKSGQRRAADRHRHYRPAPTDRGHFTEPQEYVERINQELKAGPPVVTVLDTDGAKIAAGNLTISDNQVDLRRGQ